MDRVDFDYLKEIKILATMLADMAVLFRAHSQIALSNPSRGKTQINRRDFVAQQVRTTRTMAASTEAARQCYRLHKASVALECRPCTRQTSLVMRRFCCLVRRQNSQCTPGLWIVVLNLTRKEGTALEASYCSHPSSLVWRSE
jgi:hypothetical protein